MKLHPTLRVFVALVPSLAFAQTEVLQLQGDAPADGFGARLAFIGDVDGDGAADFAVSSSSFDGAAGANCGRVKLISGRTHLPLWTVDGDSANDYFGVGLAAAGDVDLDGIPDVLVGAPKCAFFCTGGYVRVLSGTTGSVLMTLVGAASDKSYGSAVTGGHDLNGDARPDFIVGAPTFAGSAVGVVRVYDGATGALIRSHDTGLPYYYNCGWAVTFLGDVNGDGLAEYAYSWNYEQGLVVVHDGATGVRLWWRQGMIDAWSADQLGWSLAAIPDQNGDGRPDLIAGATQDATTETFAWGYVLVLDGLTGAQLAQFGPAANTFSYLGAAVAAVDDLDGDGRAEIAATAPGAANSSLRIWSIANTSTPLVTVAAGFSYGSALCFGDVSGDGLGDVSVGAPSSTTTTYGKVHVYSIVRAPTVYCESEQNSLGCTPVIGSVGTPSTTSASSFLVTASNVLNNRTGLVFYGFAPKYSLFQGGHLCVDGLLHRTPQQNSSGNPPPDDCSGVFALDFNARIRSGIDPLLIVGEEIFAQYWSRDPQDASTTNLTDALAFYINP